MSSTMGPDKGMEPGRGNGYAEVPPLKEAQSPSLETSPEVASPVSPRKVDMDIFSGLKTPKRVHPVYEPVVARIKRSAKSSIFSDAF